MIDVGCPKFFACDECPIVAELDYRLANSEKYGYPFQFDHCACDKVEDEFFYCGYCGDAWADVPKRKKKGKRKTGRAYRRKMRVQKFNRQKNLALNCNAPELWVGMDKSGLPTNRQYQLWMLASQEGQTESCMGMSQKAATAARPTSHRFRAGSAS